LVWSDTRNFQGPRLTLNKVAYASGSHGQTGPNTSSTVNSTTESYAVSSHSTNPHNSASKISPSRSVCRRCVACRFLKMPRSNARHHMNMVPPRATLTTSPSTLRSQTHSLILPCRHVRSSSIQIRFVFAQSTVRDATSRRGCGASSLIDRVASRPFLRMRNE
jgi:hypothetical protein